MEAALKQRLVGAGVIIALGIIVIPMILDGAGERQLRKMPDPPEPSKISKSGFIIHNQHEIKLPDESATIIFESNDTPVSNNEISTQNPQKKMDDVKTLKKAPQKAAVKLSETIKSDIKKKVIKSAPEIDKVQKPVTIISKQKTSNQLMSWVVQVGSFTDSKKAVSLRDDLLKKRYKAFVEKVSGRSGQLYRVRIGPMANRDLAENMSKKLKTDGVKSFITRHP